MKTARALLLFTLLLTSSVVAHDMYFISRPLILKKPEKVSLVMFLQREEIVWFASQTVQFHLFGPQIEKSLTIPDEGDPVVELKNEGTYVAGWESKPGFVKVDPPIFNKYIVLEGYSDVIRSRREGAKEQEPGREIYSRFLKTFIQVGEPRTQEFNRSLGFKIEIMPLTNPYSLQEGSDFDVRVIYDGAPLPNHKIMATYDGYSTLPEEYAEVTRTDDSGIARFHLSHKGLWMVRTNQMLPLRGNPDADWESFWTNATFQVQ